MQAFQSSLDLILRGQPVDLEGFDAADRSLLARAGSLVSSVALLSDEIVDLRRAPESDFRAEAAIEFIALTNPSAAHSIMGGATC